MYNVKDLGKKIGLYRKSLGITQEELATRLNLTAQAVSKWENELSFPDITVLPDLAKALNTSIEKLFGNDGPAAGDSAGMALYSPQFPASINGTLKLVHTLDRVGCYSEKEVEATSDDSVIFKDGSNANLRTLKIVNRGKGDICFEFREGVPLANIDMGKTEVNEVFDGVTSVKMAINNADFELTRSEDEKTHVMAQGSPLFIAKLKIAKEGELLSVLCGNENNEAGGHQENKVTIAFGCDSGNDVAAHINGSGQCIIKVPFNTGNIGINGSGDVTFHKLGKAECSINGSGDIQGNKAGDLKLKINGSGDFKSKEISGSLKSAINGSGDIYPGTGELDSFEAKICGSGDIYAEHICTRIANITIEGSGDVTVGRVLEESIEKHSKSSSIKVLKRGKED